jgi:isochorismate synthase EntC
MQSDVNSAPILKLIEKHLASFLNEGVVIQTGSDRYKLFIGPFEPTNDINKQQISLYKPEFWDFINKKNTNKVYLTTREVFDLNRKEIIELFNSILTPAVEHKISWDAPNKIAFENQFQWLKQQFKTNDLKKGLPITQQFGHGFNPNSKIQIINLILQKTSQQYLYGFWEGDSGFIGFTPEVLVSAQDKKMTTMALAGTWSKQSGGALDFSDPKIQDEHQIVVQDILAQLSEQKMIKQESTKLLELEYLVHLKTEFEFFGESVGTFVEKLHPTAALGLFPRSEKLFTELSQFDLQNSRKNFGAPFGYVGLDSSFLVVAIRNIYWNKFQVSIFSGCGVTAESDLEIEWAELGAKRNSVKKTFGLNL